MNFTIPARRKRLHLARAEMTPMIDVIFLLLVFFLVSTTQAPPEGELAPALQAEKSEAGDASDFEAQVLEIGVFAGSEGFRLGEQILRDKASLVAILESLPKEPGVFVRCADNVQASWGAAGIQACRDAGFTRVTYVPQR